MLWRWVDRLLSAAAITNRTRIAALEHTELAHAKRIAELEARIDDLTCVCSPGELVIDDAPFSGPDEPFPFEASAPPLPLDPLYGTDRA